MSEALSLSEARERILGLDPTVFEQEADRNLFYFAGEERQHPFATIITHDDNYDSFSQLDSSGHYRISAGVRRSTFEIAVLPENSSDFTIANKIMKNPVYGKMFWLSVLSPDVTVFRTFENYLRESYSLQRERTRKRVQ